VSVYFGDGYPMWLRRITMLGRSASAMAARKPASIASRSLATSPELDDVPAVAREALGTSSVYGELGRAVDGDVVVVVDVGRDGRGRVPASDAASWLTPSFEAPSPQNANDVVVDDLRAEARPQVRLRERDADPVGEALARAGRW
jgi:hypothetical protein